MKCPKDISRDDFDEMLASVPKGFVLKSTHIPKSRFVSPMWREFVFFAEKEPKPGYNLKRGDTLTLSCVLLFKPNGMKSNHKIKKYHEAVR